MKNILLHGLGQTSSSWEETVDVMENKTDIDCPDLFTLLHDKDINYYNLYQAFSEYCNAYSEPFNLCGLSLGGTLALQYGIENPDKINSMVLVGTQYVMPKMMLKFQNGIFRIMPNSAFKGMGIEKRDVINLTCSMMNLNFQKDLHKIKYPVLIICGEKDKANMKSSLQLKEQITNAHFTIIENTGHEINVEAPQDLGAVLNDFWLNSNSCG